MTDTITLTGLVATTPRHIVTSERLPITSFRLASTQRRFDRSQERWVDGETNWYTITSFRQLALNAVTSVNKGDRVVVTGRLRIRDWENGEKSGTTIDIEADAFGPDLSWGTATFSRTISHAAADSSAQRATAEAGGDATAASVDEFPAAPTDSASRGNTDDTDTEDAEDTEDAAHRPLAESVSTPF